MATWHRSEDFGSRDEWLAWTATDVIFAFYGFGEASAGPGGLEKFKADLGTFLKNTARQNYSGKGAPRVVLFSPIAQEKHSDPNIPDPAATNANLKLYTCAMAEVAQANRVAFVDAFSLSRKAYAAAGEPLTLNGHYLTDAGEKALAPLLFESLFGQAPAAGDLSRLRTVVLAKNQQWHQRYRTIDGYNVYGGRSRLSFTGKLPGGKETAKLSNNEVMQREMQQRDTLTGNRDARIWAVAQGSDLVLKDDNLPAAIPVGTNKPGERPDLKHTFLSGEEAIARMKLHSGMKLNLFADETGFPELANPVQMAWDTRGRLWVACWPNYPARTPSSTKGDTLLVLEDTDQDGKADKKTVFLADLNGPTGFQFYKDGVLVMQAPDLWFARDTDGDGKADTRERILMGLDSADSHHQTNAMALEPGGAVYLSDGIFHRTQVETARGVVRNNDGAIRETLRQLEKIPAKMILPQNPAALSFVLGRLTHAELAQAPGHEAVWQAQIDRKGIDPGVRERALGLLAKARQRSRASELLAALERNDENRGDLPAVASELAKALVLSNPAELAGARAALWALVGKARIQPVLQGAYAALIVADGGAEMLWAQTATNARGRAALLDSLSLVPDPGLRAKFHPLLTESLAAAGLPGPVRSAALKALPLKGPEFAKASFALLTKEIKEGRNRSIAARALTQLPKDAWNREEAAPVVESIISWGKSVPEKSRTGQDYVETLQVGQELAALLPPGSANGLRRQLRALGVPVFVIKTVHEQMRYDTPRIVVEPGKPLEVIFENLDAMPHNIVFVTPGARESVATAAQTMSPTTLDKKGRAYVPASEKILEASQIIEPGQKQTLKFNAPENPGEYEYVCTFPGHWMIMWGKMVVTPDVDKYLNEETTTAAANQISKP